MSMKIHFTPEAEKQMSLVARLETTRTGFASGIEIGKHVVVENLFAVDFDDKNIDKVYVELLDKIGDKLIGVFFKKDNFFKSDWFIGDLIIKIGEDRNESFIYNTIG
jgi:hypothetical protein